MVCSDVETEMKRMFRSGQSPQRIAKTLGMNVKDVVRFAKKNRLAHATETQRRQALNLLRQGHSVRQVGQLVGMSHTWVVKLAERNGIRLSQNRLDRQQKQRLRQSLLSGDMVTVAATKGGCSKSTASEYRRRLIDQGNGEVEFRNTRRGRTYRCPIHGLVNVVPCVACEASRRR